MVNQSCLVKLKPSGDSQNNLLYYKAYTILEYKFYHTIVKYNPLHGQSYIALTLLHTMMEIVCSIYSEGQNALTLFVSM